ncbi:unnamed protein product [Parnassius apollo]|uniref:(apollo) hypothetical protein n=1 Tax=Parnassius apollo TaxID=110799 RepID=A0A8S3W4D2_PARAO|nr:unnamed protein product [Parnassius apollo]
MKGSEKAVSSTKSSKKGVKNRQEFADTTIKIKVQGKDVPRKKKRPKKEMRMKMSILLEFCDERYEDPPHENLVKCYKCNLWAIEKCTSGESISKGFICDLCGEWIISVITPRAVG